MSHSTIAMRLLTAPAGSMAIVLVLARMSRT